MNNDIAISAAINLHISLTVCSGGVCVGDSGGICDGVGVGDGSGVTVFDSFRDPFLVVENAVVRFRFDLGKSLVLFVKVTSHIVSTIAVEMVSVVTVTDGDS